MEDCLFPGDSLDCAEEALLFLLDLFILSGIKIKIIYEFR